MTEHEHDKTALTLVLGGTGKTGARVVERLTALQRPVRIGSRSGEPPFDWADQRTWAPALDGATSAYLSFYPDLAVPTRSGPSPISRPGREYAGWCCCPGGARRRHSSPKKWS